MNAFKDVSYAEYAKRYIRLDKALQLDNPENIDAEQAQNMHKAFGLSYLNLVNDLTLIQKINAPVLMDIATKRCLEFEAMLVNTGE